MDSKLDIPQLTRLKAELMITTNTRGWGYIKEIANRVVEKAKEDAINEDDSVKGEALRIRARALRDGIRDLLLAIETGRHFTPPDETDEDGLGSLEIDLAQIL